MKSVNAVDTYRGREISEIEQLIDKEINSEINGCGEIVAMQLRREFLVGGKLSIDGVRAPPRAT